MRIAYICADPGVPVFGCKGSSIHVQEMLRAMRKRGACLDLFATRFDGPPPADLAEIAIHALPPAPKGELAARERQALDANDGLRYALEQASPFDLVYERYSLWSSAAMEYCRQTATPGLLEVNAPLIEEQILHRGLMDRDGAERIAAQVFSAATAVVAVSKPVAAYVERYPGTQGRVYVVSNGVNPDRFLIQPDRVHPEIFTVGFVGSLKPWHGLPVLLQAFETLHRHDGSTRLLIVGEGTERAGLEADVAQRGLQEAVRFTGAVAPEAVPAWLAAMDVAVAPYPQLENFYFSPLKIYEYMAAARPVVASAVGELVELIQDGVNGLLCPPGDDAALAMALNRLKQEPELRNRLGQAARATVLRDRTWDAVVQRIFALANARCEPVTAYAVEGKI